MKKVIHLSNRACIRTLKLGVTARRLGYKVEFWQRSAREDFKHRFRDMQFFKTWADLVERLEEAKADLIHVHYCAIPEMVAAAKAAQGERPVLCDVHDLDIVRYSTTNKAESSIFDIADALIFPCEGYQDFCIKWQPGKVNILPQTVIPAAMLPEDVVSIERLPARSGIVYQGGIVQSIPHRRITNVIKKATRNGISFVVHASNGTTEDISALVRAGATVVTRYMYRPLLNELTRYDWGLCGCDHPTKQWKVAYSNKFFEYTAARTPVIAYNADNSGDLAESLNVGVKISNIAEIKNIDPRQFDGFNLVPTMLDYQAKLKELYQQLLS